MGNRTCSIEDCDRPVLARGWCSPHYESWRRYGSPYGKPAVPLVSLPGERWKPIVRWEGRYEVSNQGRVRNVRTGEFIGWTTGKGYRLVTLCGGNGDNEQHYIHFLVAEAFIGPRPPGQEVRHLDGNRVNNVRTNLAWGTTAENAQDMLRHGTNPRANVTECPQGHPYDEANTYVKRNGGRECRTCARASKRRYKERRKGKAA